MSIASGGNGCDFCKDGRLSWRIEEMKFRQWSDKGYVHCRVVIPVGTCDKCQAKSLSLDCDQKFDEAFRREYDKLP
jgi:hypothetical protein